MRLEARKHLEDMRQAADRIDEFTHSKSWEHYAQDAMLRSAVERQFEILGEALNQLRRVEPDVVEKITHARRIIAFRNILIHGYAIVDDRVVWDVVETHLPVLAREVAALLAD